MNRFDLYRQLVRRGANTEAHERQMLLMVDALENGYETLEDYQQELDRRSQNEAAGNRAAMDVETSSNPDPRDAELAKLRAQLAERERRDAAPTPLAPPRDQESPAPSAAVPAADQEREQGDVVENQAAPPRDLTPTPLAPPRDQESPAPSAAVPAADQEREQGDVVENQAAPPRDLTPA